MLAFTMKSNSEAVLLNLLNQLKLPFDQKLVKEDFQRHPNYQSLLAISDILTTLDVPHKALNIHPEKITSSYPVPFIANARFNGHFVVVNKIDEQSVYVSDDKWNNHKITLPDFK